MAGWLRTAWIAALLVWLVGTPESHAQPLVWEHVGGETRLNGLTFDEADTLWAIGPVGRGLQHMPPGTDAWTEVSDQAGNRLLFTDAGSIIITTHSALGRSTDRGRTFESVGQPAGGGLYRVPGGPLAGRLFAGVRPQSSVEGGAAFSTDDGQTWTHVPIRRQPQHTFGGDAQAFVAVDDGPNAGRVVAACYNGLAYTDDGGETWAFSSVWEEFGYGAFSLVRVPVGSGPHGGRLLAGVEAACCSSGHVYASDDGGETWALAVDFGNVGGAVRALVWAGATGAGPETVYAVRLNSDVWHTGDGGETWEAVGNVYPGATTLVDDAVVGPDGRLYVTQDQAGPSLPTDGLYRTVTPVVSGEAGPPAQAEPTLSAYPNPVRGAATVSLTLAEPLEVRVAVYDVLGREVAMLHAGPLPAGEHALSFESAGLPAGLYLVRAEGGGFSAARRVTVVQ